MKLSSTCRKEGLKVPAFVTACMVDVESRGLDETGIYRVSGTTSDVQYIRKAFDKSKWRFIMMLLHPCSSYCDTYVSQRCSHVT